VQATAGGVASGSAVGAEGRVSVLVQDGHHEQPVILDPVAHCVREAVGRELALDDLVIVVTENGRAGVRPS
jgi:hypothetical protein